MEKDKIEKGDKTTLRNKSIGTKVSEEEYAALEKLAQARCLADGPIKKLAEARGGPIKLDGPLKPAFWLEWDSSST